MKYFGWSEKEVMDMTYEKFTMYLATIPDYHDNEDSDDTASNKPKATGSFNLFDFDQRQS